jgi:hypothetical protein
MMGATVLLIILVILIAIALAALMAWILDEWG